MTGRPSMCTPLGFQFTHPGRGATGELQLGEITPQFQFTHPGRGATSCVRQLQGSCRVSIHAPREGCDGYSLHTRSILRRFNSRTPGGVRRSISEPTLIIWCGFNSRTPGGVRRRVLPHLRTARAVSIHAPREGCDTFRSAFSLVSLEFQFTHPGRGATCALAVATDATTSFNSRTPGGVRLQHRGR